MKKAIRFFLSTLLVFVLISCTQINEGPTGSLNISADNVVKAVYRKANAETLFEFSVKITGNSSQEIVRDLLLSDVGTNKTIFKFAEIPLGGPLHIRCEVRTSDDKNTLLYEGNTTKNDIKAGQNYIKLNLDMRNRYMLWTSDKEGNRSYRMYDNLTGNFDIMTSLVGELKVDSLNRSYKFDYDFDTNGNLYTIEYDSNGSKYVVKKYPYITPDKPELIYSNTNVISCIGCNGNNVFIGMSGDSSTWTIEKITGLNNTECIANNINKKPLIIEFYKDKSMYVFVDGYQYGVVNRYDKSGQIYNFVNDFEILGLMADGPDKDIPIDPFTVSDMQIQGDYLYALIYEEDRGGLEGQKTYPFGGGILPIDISGTKPIAKSLACFDRNYAFRIVMEELETDKYLYRPVKFISRENEVLRVADDGFYRLYKPGYSNPMRDVNRVVTLSLDNPAAPVIDEINSTYGISFDMDVPDYEKGEFKFDPPYLLFGSKERGNRFFNVLKESHVLSDEPNPAPQIERRSGYSICDWYIDEDYNIYTIEVPYDGTSGYEILCYWAVPSLNNMMNQEVIYTESDKAVGLYNIAVNGDYIYFDTGTYDSSTGIRTYAVNRINKKTKAKEKLFEPYSQDLIQDKKKNVQPTALEVGNDGTIYLGIDYDLPPEGGSGEFIPKMEVVKYSKSGSGWNQKSAIIDFTKFCDSSDQTVLNSIIVSDLQLKDDMLYAIVNFVYSNSYSKGCLYAIDVSGNKFELGEPIGLLPVSSAMSDTVPENNNNQKFFYGPYKFVALKPDELVIAEDGIYETGGQYGNANCIVNMKLENGIPKFTSRHNLKDYIFNGEIQPNGCSF